MDGQPGEATNAELDVPLEELTLAAANMGIDAEAVPGRISTASFTFLDGLSDAALARINNVMSNEQHGACTHVVNILNLASEGLIPIERFLDLLAVTNNVDGADEAGHTQLCVACQINAEYAVRILVERIGVDPDLSDERNKRPLEFAASHSNLGIAKILIAAGAEVTPQVVLVACARGHVSFARWLFREGHCDVPLEPTGQELMKSVAGLGLAFEDRGETVQKWQERAEKGLAFLLGVQAAGSYTNYFAEPRYELVLLRALCSSGRAKSPTFQSMLIGKSLVGASVTLHLATRLLFGADQAQELPVGCFETILDYWWRG